MRTRLGQEWRCARRAPHGEHHGAPRACGALVGAGCDACPKCGATSADHVRPHPYPYPYPYPYSEP